uniref:Transmembrane protein 209 n=1 Tax=Glossina palpalis gambiensis TaxID=67801 RepID=A0A1B0BYW4_9MUSC
MNCKQSPCTACVRSLMVDQGLNMKLKDMQAKYYLKWSILNLLLLAILKLDYSMKCTCAQSYWFKLEYGIIVIVGLNTIACMTKYLYYIYKREPIQCTIEQKNLLEIDDNENLFIIAKPKHKRAMTSREKIQIESIIDKGHPLLNIARTRASTISTIPRLHSLRTGILQQSQQRSQQSRNKPNSRIMYSPHSVNVAKQEASYSRNLIREKDEIDNEASLTEYLKKISVKEKDKDIDNLSVPANRRCLNSFWRYGNATSEYKNVYQLAPTDAFMNSNERIRQENIDLYMQERNCTVIMRIPSEKLSRYVYNLRTWISLTILQRLAEEIHKIDESFKCHNLNMQIGSIDLKGLKKTLNNKLFINTRAPMLPLVVQFLDITDNQIYLVQRIKDFAEGWCIADYNWNTGSDHLYFKWNDQLPTDAAIIFHFFCVYFDTQLLPLPHKANRPFYSRYVIIAEHNRCPLDTVAMVNNRAGCAILCTDPLKPKFNFISHGEIHNCAYDRNNLFYVIIHFLLYMRKYRDNFLEGTSLGVNGINIMHVIGD